MRWNQRENQYIYMALEGRDGNKSVFQSLFTQTLTDLQAVFQGYLSHACGVNLSTTLIHDETC